MGGSSSKVTVGYKYHLGMQMILCHSSLDALYRVMVDKRIAWEGESTGGQIEIDAEDLFGGESREGGVSGLIDVEMGGPDQLQNDYLQAQIQEDIPAFRGVSGVVLRQAYTGMNPYLKPWSFRAKRIHLRSDGSTQWYDIKAEIPTKFSSKNIPGMNSIPGYFINIDYKPDSEIRPDPDNSSSTGWTTFDPPDDEKGRPWTSPEYMLTDWISPFPELSNHRTTAEWTGGQFPIGELSENGTDGGASAAGYDTNFKFASPRQSATFARLPVYFQNDPDPAWLAGSTDFDIWIDNAITISVNGHLVFSQGYYYGGENQGSYSNQYFKKGLNIIAVSLRDDLGGVATDLAMLTFKDSAAVLPGGTALESGQGDMNPAHIIRECLIDRVWGMGYLEADIDDTSFRYAADVFYDEGMGISLMWDRQIPIEDFVQEIIRHVNAVLYVDRTTGLFVLNPVRDDYDESEIPTLGELNIERVSDYGRTAPGDVVNSVTVVFWDSGTGENASVTADDVALIQSAGGVVGTTVQYPGFTNQRIGARVAQRDLKTLSTPLLTATIEANREASVLNIGDVFKFEWSDYHDGYIVMRVNDVALGDGSRNRVKIIATEDVFSLPTGVLVSGESGGWTDPSAAEPLPASPRVVTEAPYYSLVVDRGQVDVDAILAQDEYAGFLLVSAGRQANEISATLMVDDGSGYAEGGPLEFSPYVISSIDAGPTDSKIYYAASNDSELFEAGLLAYFGDEIVRIDGLGSDVDGAYIDVGRGVLDTTPDAHAAGTDLVMFSGYEYSDEVQYTSGESVLVKEVTRLGQGALPLSEAPEDEAIFSYRAIRPYPPGDARIDDYSYPEPDEFGNWPIYCTEGSVITWAHRSRTQQTSGDAFDYTDGDIGPEAGTTYRIEVEVFNAAGGSLGVTLTEPGISGTAYTISSDPGVIGAAMVEIRIYSEREGHESWQPARFYAGYQQEVGRTLEDGTPRLLENGTQRSTG